MKLFTFLNVSLDGRWIHFLLLYVTPSGRNGVLFYFAFLRQTVCHEHTSLLFTYIHHFPQTSIDCPLAFPRTTLLPNLFSAWPRIQFYDGCSLFIWISCGFSMLGQFSHPFCRCLPSSLEVGLFYRLPETKKEGESFSYYIHGWSHIILTYSRNSLAYFDYFLSGPMPFMAPVMLQHAFVAAFAVFLP